MNPARHRVVALRELEELVRMKARHADVRLLAHGAVDTGKLLKFRSPRAETVMRAYEIAGCTQVKSSLQLVQPCVLVAIDSLLHLRWSQNLCSFAFMSCNKRSRGVTGRAQVSFDGLRATDVLASLMAWTRQYAFACTGSKQCLCSVASMS